MPVLPGCYYIMNEEYVKKKTKKKKTATTRNTHTLIMDQVPQRKKNKKQSQ